MMKALVAPQEETAFRETIGGASVLGWLLSQNSMWDVAAREVCLISVWSLLHGLQALP